MKDKNSNNDRKKLTEKNNHTKENKKHEKIKSDVSSNSVNENNNLENFADSSTISHMADALNALGEMVHEVIEEGMQDSILKTKPTDKKSSKKKK